MLLKYLGQNTNSGKPDAKASAPASNIQITRTKTKKSHVFCFYLLANILVWNAVYGLKNAGNGKSILQTISSDNVICRLWQDHTNVSSKSPKKGTITGILYSSEKPAAMINTEIIYEGTVIDNIRVIRIDAEKVQFEKNGKRWTQAMHQKPDPAWRDS